MFPLFTDDKHLLYAQRLKQSAKRAALIVAVFVCSGVIAFVSGAIIQ